MKKTMSEHPMTQKARKLFKESLKESTPIRWLMVNTQKIRTVTDAVRTCEKHCEKYPDIAKEYNAKEIMKEEMICERQAVLCLRTKAEAVRFLSVWYNRPGTVMAYRYETIQKEAKAMNAEDLRKEKEIFKVSESQKMYENAMHPLLTAVAESEDEKPINETGYAALAIINIEKRISDLQAKRETLIEEKQGRTGRIKEILEKREAEEKLISSIETLTEEIKKGSAI